jgi:hypothetical protein
MCYQCCLGLAMHLRLSITVGGMCSAGFSATTFRIRILFIKGNHFQTCSNPSIAYDRLLGGVIIFKSIYCFILWNYSLIRCLSSSKSSFTIRRLFSMIHILMELIFKSAFSGKFFSSLKYFFNVLGIDT